MFMDSSTLLNTPLPSLNVSNQDNKVNKAKGSMPSNKQQDPQLHADPVDSSELSPHGQEYVRLLNALHALPDNIGTSRVQELQAKVNQAGYPSQEDLDRLSTILGSKGL